MTRGTSAVGVAVLGGGLIAITYGLARFAFGLFLPSIREDMMITPTLAGVIGALPFVSFVAAILVAPTTARLVGVRWAAAISTTFALVGLATICWAPDPYGVALGVLTCGISTGLSTPIMADAVHKLVALSRQARVNATINAGTSLGIAVTAPAIFTWGDSWRSAYAVFAVLAAVGVVAALVYLPRREVNVARFHARAAAPRISNGQRLRIARLSALAAVMGFVSALYWVFAPDFTVNGGGASAYQAAWMWLAVGVGGLAGMAAGDMVDRYGLAMSHAFAFAMLSAALTLLAAAPGNGVLAMASAAAFGAAYMNLTGVYLVGGTRILPDQPALGPVVPFLAISAGQIAGSPVGGWLIETWDYGTAFGAFATVGLVTATVSLWLAVPAPPVACPAEPDD